MQIILLIIMLFVVKAFLNHSDTDSLERWRQQAKTVSTLIEYYSNQNVKQCKKTTCSTGVLSGSNFPSKTDTINNEWAYGTNFVSAYGTTAFGTGTMDAIVTVFYPPQYGQSGSSDPKALFGWIAQNLRSDSGNSVFAGQWDAATQSVNGGNTYTYGGATSNFKVIIPQGFGGITLQDKQPILVSRVK